MVRGGFSIQTVFYAPRSPPTGGGDGIAPGRYAVTQGLPERIVRLWVYCSRDWNPDDRLPAQTTPWFGEDHPLGRFTTKRVLEPYADILCDFYAIPAPAGEE
jgi:hypothetical protein